jgi:hypothetical protein
LRLWFLNDADPASPDVIALRTAVGCAHAGEESVDAVTPDIDDGGDLIRGNQQIHPALKKSSTCTPAAAAATARRNQRLQRRKH